MPKYSVKQIDACWQLLNKGGSVAHICECFQCGRNIALNLQKETIQKYGKPEQKPRPFDVYLNGNGKHKICRPEAEYSNKSW